MTRDQWLSMMGTWFVAEPSTGCWLWVRATTNDGYGQKVVGGRVLYAHRISYSLLRGPIPDGMTLDHLCRVRCCVNPDHLEPVTMRTNLLRGKTATARNLHKTHCLRGHAFSPDNTYRPRRFPWRRECKECHRAWVRIYRERAK